MPLTTLGPTIGANGITAPSFSDILLSLQQSYQAIFGTNAYISTDSQDGQFLSLMATAINDLNQAIIAMYNGLSPNSAQGTNLSAMVKINGLKRNTPTNSTAAGTVTGVAGTTINNGVVADTNGNLWDLPASVTIPGGGSISVTVTAEQAGNIVAPSGTINKINTPVQGWQSFVSTADAVPGLPVESDAALRIRQLTAAALPANTPLAGLLASLQALPGVTRVSVYENATNAVDANGAPGRSIYVVIEGGVQASIAQAIGQKKTPGASTYGTTSVNYTDAVTGITYTINFFVVAYTTINVALTVKSAPGYSSAVTTKIQNALAQYLSNLPIGTSVQFSRLYSVAYLQTKDNIVNGSPLPNDPDGSTFEITALTANGGTSDITIPFNQTSKTLTSQVTVTVT